MKTRRQFLAVYSGGRRAGCPSFTFFALPNQLGHCRAGVTATRKLGGAATRNRAKRRLRELFRRNHASFAVNVDLVMNAHPALLERDFAVLEAEFRRCARRLAPPEKS